MVYAVERTPYVRERKALRKGAEIFTGRIARACPISLYVEGC